MVNMDLITSEVQKECSFNLKLIFFLKNISYILLNVSLQHFPTLTIVFVN